MTVGVAGAASLRRADKTSHLVWIPAAPLSYLATFTFVAGREARGTFIVNLLYDDNDPAQRTFLFPTPADGKIAIRDVASAVITVASRAADRKR